MATIMLLPSTWHLLLLASGVSSLLVSFFDVYYFQQSHTSSIYITYSYLTGLTYLFALILQAHYFFRKQNVNNYILIRFAIDQIVYIAGIVCLPKFASLVCLLYITTSWLQLFSLLSIRVHHRYITVLQSLMLFTTAIVFLHVNDIIHKIIFTSLFVLSYLFSFCYTKTQSRLHSVEKEELSKKQIEKMLLKHNFGNMASIVYCCAETDIKDDAMSQAVIKAIDVMKNVIDSLVEEGEEIRCKLRTIIDRVIGMCVINSNTCEATHNITKHYTVKTNLCSFIHSLLVFVNNSCEAQSKRISIRIENERYLVVEDDGVGFDTSKIRLGHTTKKNGHGFGLVQAIQSCKTNRIPLEIHSKIGEGTKISLDLQNILITDQTGMR